MIRPLLYDGMIMKPETYVMYVSDEINPFIGYNQPKLSSTADQLI
jgi:hypothetical protein